MTFYQVDSKNMYIANLKDTVVLKSYNTIIAIALYDKVLVTDTYYSVTTSRHKNLFLRDYPYLRTEVVPQNELDKTYTSLIR